MGEFANGVKWEEMKVIPGSYKIPQKIPQVCLNCEERFWYDYQERNQRKFCSLSCECKHKKKPRVYYCKEEREFLKDLRERLKNRKNTSPIKKELLPLLSERIRTLNARIYREKKFENDR